MKYKRVLLKLSGEVLGGSKGFGISAEALAFYSSEIKKAVDAGTEISLVIGGGNIFRGADLVDNGFSDPIKGDYMGMLATVINGIALQTAFEKAGIKTKLITASHIDKVGEMYHQDKVNSYLKEGFTLIFTGGTGNPLFTTDSAAAMRAIEIGADVLMKATKVDGVYDADPIHNKNAKRFETIGFDEVLKRQLKVMDLTAFALCSENKMPILVYNSAVEGNLLRSIEKGDIGTIIS
ncbi:MAG: UMP kinase [Bacteroidetes bacterium]|jgi:uridylate kinase|nr:UMP kinase [Bacteroidota bacterium]MBT6835954.1 UMP kinase [Bacteroidota bacterium]MBT7993859.1 UMP kinase [Bacteroidota bacterium]